MERYLNIIEKISKAKEDVRVELLLSELLESGQIKLHEKKVKTLGIFRRGYRKDIDTVELVREDKFGDFKHLLFSVWREGIYDSLPKGLFHHLRKENVKKDIANIKEGVEEEEKQREAARDFFYPVEQEFFNHRIFLELTEREVLAGFKTATGVEMFARNFWNLDVRGIATEKVISLLYLLPYAFRYKGQLDELKVLFSFVLEDKVEWKMVWGNVQQVGEEQELTLGDTYLGDNLVLGNSFEDGIPSLMMEIGPVKAEQAMAYLPERGQYKLLHLLERFFLPMETVLSVEIGIEQPDQQFRLSKGEGTVIVLDEEKGKSIKNYNNILGYTSFI